MLAGGTGMHVGLLARPTERAQLRRYFSPHWKVVEMWHPGEIFARAERCHVVLYAPSEAPDGEPRLAAVRACITDQRTPLVLYSESTDPQSHLLLGRGPTANGLAVRPSDERYVGDYILDTIARPLLSRLAATIRDSCDVHPALGAALAALIEEGVLPFRQAAELLGHGTPSFVRRKKDLAGSLVELADAASVDLVEVLCRHMLFQAALRYIPGRGYSLAVRLNFRTDDALRMAIRRGLGVKLSELGTIAVRPLAVDLLRAIGRANISPHRATPRPPWRQTLGSGNK
jgi:hypothetical protein